MNTVETLTAKINAARARADWDEAERLNELRRFAEVDRDEAVIRNKKATKLQEHLPRHDETFSFGYRYR